MKRTVVLLASMALAVLLACGVTLVGMEMEAQGQAKPNIVFVLTDDQFPAPRTPCPTSRAT